MVVIITLVNGVNIPENSILTTAYASLIGSLQLQSNIYLVQYDNQIPIIAVHLLTQNNTPFIPNETDSLSVRMGKPDGKGVVNACLGYDSNGVIYFAVTQQMTAVYGTGEITIQIDNDNGTKNSSIIQCYIKKNPVQENQIESTNEFKTLYEILQIALEVQKIIVDNQGALSYIQNNSNKIDTVFENIDAINTDYENIESIKTTSDNISNINNVSNNIENINSILKDIEKIQIVSNNISDINNVSDNIEDVKTVSNNIDKISIINDNIEPINIVANNINNINNVSNNMEIINNVNNNKGIIKNVNDNLNSIVSVNNNIDNINSVVNNESNINSVVENLDAINSAPEQAKIAEDNAILAKSWAIGGTGVREDEETNNAKYYAEQAQAVSQGALGYYETPELLKQAHPTGTSGQWAIIGSTDTIWVWDVDTNNWKDTSQGVDLSNYYTKSQSDNLFALKDNIIRILEISINPEIWVLDSNVYKAEFNDSLCTSNSYITNVFVSTNNGINITTTDIDNASNAFDYIETNESKIILYSKEKPNITINLCLAIKN